MRSNVPERASGTRWPRRGTVQTMTNVNRRQLLKRTGSAIGIATLGAAGTAGTATAHYDPSMVNTRDHLSEGCDLINGETKTSYDTDGTVPCVDTGCVSDLTVMVHGWNNTHDDAIAKADECAHSLYGNGYDGEVIGFSWDSDKGDFGDAECIAQKNGPKLGNFLQDYKLLGGDTLQVVSHSLGAQVLLSALRWLDSNSTWDDYGYELDSVHMLGAAVDNEAPTKEWPDTYYAIHNETTATFNYFSTEDDAMSWYQAGSWDQPLDETGAEDGNTVSCNYTDYDATSQVGDCHSCYLDELGYEITYHMNHVGYYDC